MVKLKADDNLAPIRNRISDLIKPNSKVIEFGCGKGNLLIELSPKIKTGLGIDKSMSAVEQAIRQRDSRNIHNVDFICADLGHAYTWSESYDVSIASLFYHVITPSIAVHLLNTMKEISNTILICGFSRPVTMKEKFLMWLDQGFSNHYGNFKKYRKHGYTKGLFERTLCRNVSAYDTDIPFLKIYEVN